jgi:SHS2 domain-containing protein
VYSIIEHTADLGITATGTTLNQAFEEVARGMFAIMTNDGLIENRVKKTVTIEGTGDLELLVVDWLSELLYLRDVKGLVFGDFSVTVTEKGLSAIVQGEPYDRKKHGYGAEIKAVTYHMLEIQTHKKGVTINVLFDV